MFDVSWGEMFLIGIVALVVIGPKELPGVLRAVGQGVSKLRRMASDFQYQFNQAIQESDLDKVKSTVENATSSFDPVSYAREQIKSAVDDVKSAVAPPPADPVGPPVEINLPTPTYEPTPEQIMADFAPPKESSDMPQELGAPVETVPEEAPAKPKRVRKPKASSDEAKSGEAEA